jgi:hypothetical protein
MNGRENKVYEEAAALWRTVRGGAPPPHLTAQELLLQVLEDMEAASYDRLHDADRRGRDIVWPH